MEDGETLQYDPTVYDCMSTLTLDWPSLSFDLLRDHLGGPRAAFPHTLFMVAGTQVRCRGGWAWWARAGQAGPWEPAACSRAWLSNVLLWPDLAGSDGNKQKTHPCTPGRLQASSAKQNYLAVMKVSNLALSKEAAQRQKEQAAAAASAAAQKDGGNDSDSDEDMLEESDADSDAGLFGWVCLGGWVAGCTGEGVKDRFFCLN